MDIISGAMNQKKHLCNDIEMGKQKWEIFNEYVNGKRLFLFGAGAGMNYFLQKYGHQVQITGVIDNDVSIQGQNLGECCDGAWRTEYEELIIYAPEKLREYPEQDIVVLITSINFYQAMMKQMEELGIQHCFALLLLEADRRNTLADKEEDIDRIHVNYIDKYCHRDIEEKKIIMLIGVYGSHARQITKALLSKRKDLDIVWIVNDMRIAIPEGVRVVYERNRKKYIYEMETAKIWIFDDIISPHIRKRDSQIYIQVKHWSSVTLKKFYLDDTSPVLTPEAVANIKFDGARMDYLFSGSEFDEKSCRSGFNFQGKSIRVGSPRSDVLFDSTMREKVFSHFQLDRGANICLYVPTYRLKNLEPGNVVSLTLEMPPLLEALESKWGGTWYLFMRIHPGLMYNRKNMFQNEHIIDVGGYADSQELVAASNVMLTDYSSIMFEAAYVKKPVFLYAPDRRSYINGERKLLIDYDHLPFSIAETNNQLIQNIEFFEQSEYEKKLENFLKEYGVHEDGHASERAAQFINELLAEGNLS